MYFDYVDCEECVHYEDYGYCSDCINNPDHDDYFMQCDPNAKAERAKKHQIKFLAGIPKEEITITPSPEFMEQLRKAWKFVPQDFENDKFFHVYCGEDSKGYLMVTDGMRLIKLEVDHHEKFVAKHLIWDDVENKLYSKPDSYSSALSNGAAADLLKKREGTKTKGDKNSLPFKNVHGKSENEKDKWVEICGVRINKNYLDDVLDLISDNEEITITFGEKFEPLLINTQGIIALIMPIRYYD